MPVAVTFHHDFGICGHMVLKDRIGPSFAALAPLIDDGKIDVYTPEIKKEHIGLIEQIHTRRHIDEVKSSGLYEIALLSVASVVSAADMLAQGQYGTAFAYVGAAGHHASRMGFWGFCYFNDVAAAIFKLRAAGYQKFLILDVDPHFGDGTRNLFEKDNSVIHINFDTSTSNRFDELNKNFDYGLGVCQDKQFLKAIEDSLRPEFEFEIMIVIFGHDSHVWDYGGFQLTFAAYPQLALRVKEYAGNKPLLWVLSGGSNPEVAKQAIPDILKVLSE